MRLTAALLSCFALALPALATSHAPNEPRPRPVSANEAVFVPDELLVGWNGPAVAGKRDAAADFASEFDCDLLPAPGLEPQNAARLRVRAGADLAAVAARISASPGVRYVERNAVVYPADVPTDPLYAGVNSAPTDLQRWAFGGVGDNRVMNAEAAWDVTKGDPAVVIAVLDSGLAASSTEFQHVWVNKGEIPDNGVDDDHNGYVDDVNGFDFHNRTHAITPDLGDGIDNDFNDRIDDSAPHGTIAASLIGAAHDGSGMAGAAPDCTLMIVKIFGDDGGVTIDQLAEAIRYAAANGADVMNLSLATPFDSQTLRDAVQYAVDHKVIMVAAAGNGDRPARQYPATLPGVLSVGGSGSGLSASATSQQTTFGPIDGRWRNSQYGPTAVNVVAPAVVLGQSFVTVGAHDADPSREVGSTFYDIFQGTSFSAPYAAGLAGLVVSRDIAVHGRRTLVSADVRALLMNTARDLPADFSDLEDSGAGWDGRGRIDFAAALAGIPGAADPNPRVDRASYSHKQLRVYGAGFSAESQVEVNGTLSTAVPAFSYAEGSIVFEGSRRQLALKKGRGQNHLVVVERGARSPAITF